MFTAYCALPCGLYLVGVLPLFDLLILLPFISFRLTGKYVLHSVLHKQYKGYDIVLGMWLLALAWAHLFMAPLPFSLFYSRFASWFGYDPFPQLTLQRVLPFVIIAHTALRNCSDVLSHRHVFWPAPSATVIVNSNGSNSNSNNGNGNHSNH